MFTGFNVDFNVIGTSRFNTNVSLANITETYILPPVDGFMNDHLSLWDC